jgi:glutamate synthase (NADPH/NADH) large chain
MTGGRAVILGEVGENFAAGMTGGMAYVYDPDDKLEMLINSETVTWQRVEVDHWEVQLRETIFEHVRETHSRWAEGILRDWDLSLPKFWQVVPKDLIAIGALDAPIKREELEPALA